MSLKLKTVVLLIKYGEKLISSDISEDENSPWLNAFFDEMSKSTQAVKEEFTNYIADFLSNKRLHALNTVLIKLLDKANISFFRGASITKQLVRLEVERYKTETTEVPLAIMQHYKNQIIEILKSTFPDNCKTDEKLWNLVKTDLEFSLGIKTTITAQPLFEAINVIEDSIELSDQAAANFLEQLPDLKKQMLELQNFKEALHEQFQTVFLKNIKNIINESINKMNSVGHKVKTVFSKVSQYQGLEQYNFFKKIVESFNQFFKEWNKSFESLECQHYAQLKAYQFFCDASLKHLEALVNAIQEDNSKEKPIRNAAEAAIQAFTSQKNSIEKLLGDVGVLFDTAIESESSEITQGTEIIFDQMLETANRASVDLTEPSQSLTSEDTSTTVKKDNKFINELSALIARPQTSKKPTTLVLVEEPTPQPSVINSNNPFADELVDKLKDATKGRQRVTKKKKGPNDFSNTQSSTKKTFGSTKTMGRTFNPNDPNQHEWAQLIKTLKVSPEEKTDTPDLLQSDIPPKPNGPG